MKLERKKAISQYIWVISMVVMVFACAKPQLVDQLKEEDYDFITQEYRGGIVLLDSSWLVSGAKLRPNSTLAWYPIQNVKMEMEGPCDSCHSASGNYFEFEHISFMRNALDSIFPGVDSIVEMTPGIGDFADNSVIDSLHIKLIDEIEQSPWSIEHLNLISPFHGFYIREKMTLLEPILKEVRAKVRADYLWLPMQTQITLFPKSNKPHGEVKLIHHYILFDLKKEQVLIQVYQDLLWDSGNELIDRNLSLLLLNPMLPFLQNLQDSVPSWAH